MCVCVCVRLRVCMLAHTCLNVCWGSDRLKLLDGGRRNMPFFFPWSCILFGGVTWRHFITDPKKTAQERCKMQKDSNCTTKWNEKSERMKNEDGRGGGGKRTGTWQRKRNWHRSALLNESKTAQWCCSASVIHLSLFLFKKKDMNTHTYSSGRLDEHFTVSTTKQTSKFCSFAIHRLSNVPVSKSAQKQFTASWPVVVIVIFCCCFLAHLLMSEGCQGKDVDWAEGYPWAYHVKQYKFISYSSEWLFSAGGSWRYLSHSPFSLWFGSFEQCGPRQLVRTATSVTLPPGWRGVWGVGGGRVSGRWGRWQRWKGCSEGCWGGCRMIG